jgi:uncharacterized protein YndB with AHSA1/START domain
MTRLHAGILVQQPIAVVFAYLCRPDGLSSWVTGVLSADGASPERQGVGAKLVVQRAGFVGAVRSTWEVTTYEPPRILGLRALDESAGVEVFWTLESAATGATRISVETDLCTIGFFGTEAGYVEASGTRQLHADLEVLRRHLEVDT